MFINETKKNFQRIRYKFKIMDWIYVRILVAAILIALFVWGQINLSKSCNKLHKKLDVVEAKAEDANTMEELKVAWDELKVISEEVFFHAHQSRVSEISAIIRTKQSMLSKKV